MIQFPSNKEFSLVTNQALDRDLETQWETSTQLKDSLKAYKNA